MAARIAGQAEGGEILVSEAVRDAVGDLSDVILESAEVVELKGLSGTHEVFPVVLNT
jgi:adenylate cyclase